jgi:hypothetical protein
MATEMSKRFLLAALVLPLVAGCSLPWSGQQGEAAVSPGGDIPDTQAFVAYTPPSGLFTLKVPEGWARTEQGSTTTFADKLNRIDVSTVPAAAAPTPETARARELPALQAAAKGFRSPAVSAVSPAGGAAVLLTYEADSTADPVTGKTVRDAVQRYEFWRNGTELVLTLSSPVGADNTDPWKTVVNSFAWR